MTQVKWRPLFWTSFHKVSTVITAYTRENKDELYQDLESSDPRDSVDRELADFAQKKKKKKRSCLSGAGGSCQILQYVQHMTPLYIWRSDWHRKNLGLGLGGQQQREIFPFWEKKKQIIATYAEYIKVVELQCREYTVKHCIKTDCGIMI